jgi:alpha-glucosidase
MAMLLLMTMRGNVFIYQGEELALPQAHVPFERLVDPEAIANWPRTLGRDGARTPLPWKADEPQAGFSTVEPWLPVDPGHLALSVDRQERKLSSMLHTTRRLVAFRKVHRALLVGEMKLLEVDPDLLCFERVSDGERLLCVFNLGHAPVSWTPPRGLRILESVNLEGSPPGTLPPMAGLVLAGVPG